MILKISIEFHANIYISSAVIQPDIFQNRIFGLTKAYMQEVCVDLLYDYQTLTSDMCIFVVGLTITHLIEPNIRPDIRLDIRIVKRRYSPIPDVITKTSIVFHAKIFISLAVIKPDIFQNRIFGLTKAYMQEVCVDLLYDYQTLTSDMCIFVVGLTITHLIEPNIRPDIRLDIRIVKRRYSPIPDVITKTSIVFHAKIFISLAVIKPDIFQNRIFGLTYACNQKLCLHIH